MAKYTHSYTIKGELDAGALEVEETVKESVDTHDLGEVLKQFHGKIVTISIKEEEIATPKNY